MGFLDVLLGRTRPARPSLDGLFAVPAAATTLAVSLDLAATGVGGVCFKAAEGEPAERARTEALALLRLDPGTAVEASTDEYGYTWVVCRRTDADLPALVTDLHGVNTTLVEAGFGIGLLCTVIGFASAAGTRVGLVYLFKRGTFYPLAPRAGHTRDTELELRVRAGLDGELPIEPDLSRWFPIWGGPVP